MTQTHDENDSIIEIMRNESMHIYKSYTSFIIESSKKNSQSFRDYALNRVLHNLYSNFNYLCTCIFFMK